MSTTADAFAGPIPPVAVPAWPGLRCADLIEAGLRDLDGAQRDVMLRAVACAVDRYLAILPGRPAQPLEAALEEALDEVLRVLPPMNHARPARAGHVAPG